MNKGGQFFLIAAVVIAGIIITLGAVYITTGPSTTEETALYDLSEEIDYESSQLIDYGVYSESSRRETNESILSFVMNYSIVNPDTDILLVYGDADSLTILYYNHTSSGFLGISTGGSPIGLTQQGITPTKPSYEITDNNVKVRLNPEKVMEFELNPGENFFIALTKQIGGETIVT